MCLDRVEATLVAAAVHAAVALRLLVSHDNAVEKEEARQAALRAQVFFAEIAGVVGQLSNFKGSVLGCTKLNKYIV